MEAPASTRQLKVARELQKALAEIIRSKGPFYFCKGRGSVGGKLAVSAEFSFALVPKEA